VFGRLGFIGIVALALVVVVSQSGGGNAAQATITQSCPAGEAGGVTVSFVWPAPPGDTTETYLDIGLHARFPTGSFQSYGPFPREQLAYALAGLPPGVKYHYRVNAHTPAAWKPNAQGSFTTTCGTPPRPLTVAQRCIEGPEPGPADDGVAATFTWQPGTAGEHWIDVSADGPGFATGSYTGSGPGDPAATSRDVTGLARGTQYWWRVSVRTPGGWLVSQPAEFTTLPCPRS